MTKAPKVKTIPDNLPTTEEDKAGMTGGERIKARAAENNSPPSEADKVIRSKGSEPASKK